MSNPLHYDVYDNDELILTNVTRMDLEKYFNCTFCSLAKYDANGVKYRGRYTIILRENDQTGESWEDAFKREWDETVKLFK